MMMALTIPLSFHQTAKVLSEGGRCGGVRAVDLRAVNVGRDGVQLLSDSGTGAVRGGSDKLVTSLGKSRVGERNRDGETLGGEARSVAAVQLPGLQIDLRGEADVVVQKLTKLHQHHSKPDIARVILFQMHQFLLIHRWCHHHVVEGVAQCSSIRKAEGRRGAHARAIVGWGQPLESSGGGSPETGTGAAAWTGSEIVTRPINGPILRTEKVTCT